MLATPAGADPPSGTARGQLTLNGTSVVLQYAYATAQPGFFDESTEDVRVLLSDVPLDEEARHDVFALIHLARDGSAHAVEVVIDAQGQPISGGFYAPEFDGMISATGMHRFERDVLERTRIGGRLSTSGAHEFQGVTYAYNVRFAAVIPRPPTAEEIAAQLASPPARVASAAIAAALAGRRDEFLHLLDRGERAWFEADAAHLAAFVEDLAGASHVVGLTQQDANGALATVNGTRDGVVIESTLELALVGGTWVITRAGVHEAQ